MLQSTDLGILICYNYDLISEKHVGISYKSKCRDVKIKTAVLFTHNCIFNSATHYIIDDEMTQCDPQRIETVITTRESAR